MRCDTIFIEILEGPSSLHIKILNRTPKDERLHLSPEWEDKVLFRKPTHHPI